MNKVFLIGNLTRDPEMRTTPNGVSVCQFGLAVNRRRKVEGQPEADFYSINAWRQLGDLAMRYLAKGRKAAIVGNLTLRTYTGNDGQQRYSLDVDADEIEFLPSGEKRQGGANQQAGHDPEEGAHVPDSNGFVQVDEDELPF